MFHVTSNEVTSKQVMTACNSNPMHSSLEERGQTTRPEGIFRG
jgi:hypothetical protein